MLTKNGKRNRCFLRTISASGKEGCRHLRGSVAGGVILQVDLTTPADQTILRNFDQCCEEPDLGRAVHLPASGHHQN